MGDMSTRPTEPGNYHWKKHADAEWEPVHVRLRHLRGVQFEFLRLGINDAYSVNNGIWGPRIPDPDEPRAEPAGGLTGIEARALQRVYLDINAKYAELMGIDPEDMGWPEGFDNEAHYCNETAELAAALSANLAEFGFTRLTDAEIAAGVRGYYRAGQKVLSSLTLEQINGWEEKAKPIQVAAFRRAVAEAREAKG